MMRDRPSRSILLRYSLFQIPSAALLAVVLVILHRRLDLSPWIGWGIFLFWIAKDAVLFPLVWRSYQGDAGGTCSMTGLTGTARTNFSHRGKVEVRGEIWHAETPDGHPPVVAGSKIRVVSSRGLTLVVEGVSAAPREGAAVSPPPGRV
jgi:membrane protein implicated in regulation of membrane protease activity